MELDILILGLIIVAIPCCIMFCSVLLSELDNDNCSIIVVPLFVITAVALCYLPVQCCNIFEDIVFRNDPQEIDKVIKDLEQKKQIYTRLKQVDKEIEQLKESK